MQVPSPGEVSIACQDACLCNREMPTCWCEAELSDCIISQSTFLSRGSISDTKDNCSGGAEYAAEDQSLELMGMLISRWGSIQAGRSPDSLPSRLSLAHLSKCHLDLPFPLPCSSAPNPVAESQVLYLCRFGTEGGCFCGLCQSLERGLHKNKTAFFTLFPNRRLFKVNAV